jgi:hypothetical protein
MSLSKKWKCDVVRKKPPRKQPVDRKQDNIGHTYKFQIMNKKGKS